MLPKLDPIYSDKAVREQLLPDHYIKALPSEDELWLLGSKTEAGWKCKPQRNYESPRYVHRCPDLAESNLAPKVLQDMQADLDCPYIAMFASDCEQSIGSLTWHIDAYHVWAFNIEGVTEWEWFDVHRGEIKTMRLEPRKNMISMPCGISHRVNLITNHRMSVSFVKPAEIKDLS